MIKKIYLTLCLLSLGFAGELPTKDVRAPSSAVFDITNSSTSDLNDESTLSKIPIKVNYIWGYKNRNNIIDKCGTDTLSVNYCPIDLAPCAENWTYVDGISYATTKVQSVDTGCTGIVKNGTCYTAVGDAQKQTNLSCRNMNLACMPGADGCCHIDFSCNNNAVTIKYYDCCYPTGGLKFQNTYSNINDLISGVSYQQCGGAPIVCTQSGACSMYFQNYWCASCGLVGSPFLANSFTLNTSEDYYCPDNQFVGSEVDMTADPTKCYSASAISCPANSTLNATTKTCDTNYDVYAYKCPSSINQYQESYQVVDPGGVDCKGVGIKDFNADGKLECNSPTAPKNNCKQKFYSCLADVNRPCAKVSGQFQCSPFECDSDKKCGYANCPTEFAETNTPEVTPLTADPLKYKLKGSICTGLKCDLVNGPYYSMCGKKSCPQGFGIYEKNNACWKDACPSGSVEINGECIKKN